MNRLNRLKKMPAVLFFIGEIACQKGNVMQLGDADSESDKIPTPEQLTQRLLINTDLLSIQAQQFDTERNTLYEGSEKLYSKSHISELKAIRDKLYSKMDGLKGHVAGLCKEIDELNKERNKLNNSRKYPICKQKLSVDIDILHIKKENLDQNSRELYVGFIDWVNRLLYYSKEPALETKLNKLSIKQLYLRTIVGCLSTVPLYKCLHVRAQEFHNLRNMDTYTLHQYAINQIKSLLSYIGEPNLKEGAWIIFKVKELGRKLTVLCTEKDKLDSKYQQLKELEKVKKGRAYSGNFI